MPIYEYKCKECGFIFEAFVSFEDYKKPQTCPNCNKEDGGERVIITPPVVHGAN